MSHSDGKRLRILHVLNTPRAEGTPNLVLDWLAAGTGHWQGVLVLNSQPADLTDQLRHAADYYEEHHLITPGKKKYLNIARASYRAAVAQRPDLIVCWPTGFSPWISAGVYAAGCRKILVHAGNPAGLNFRNRLITKYVTWPLTMMRAKVICCSDYVEESYRQSSNIPRSLFHSVYNCTRSTEVIRRSRLAKTQRIDRRPTAIMVATFEDHKDHETLLKAVPSIREQIPAFRLLLAGDGTCRRKIEQLIRDLNIVDTVELLGVRRDVPELLGQSDLFLFSTTLQEGLGSVLLEAMAAGLPIVATDVPACRELLDGGRWGRLVTVRDSVELARQVITVLQKPAENQAEDARIYASTFTPSRMMNQYLQIAGFNLG